MIRSPWSRSCSAVKQKVSNSGCAVVGYARAQVAAQRRVQVAARHRGNSDQMPLEQSTQ